MIDLFCIASGPSLLKSDCDLVKQAGVKVIAVNNSWRLVPWCDYLYAGDSKWWRAYAEEINISAERWTCSRLAHINFDINFHIAGGGYNSGLRAIQFGIMKGFKNIALLGYDCSVARGIHWHGPHDRPFLKNPTEAKVEKWHTQFAKLAEKAKHTNIRIVNCSRFTALKCFQLLSLEDVLQENSCAVH